MPIECNQFFIPNNSVYTTCNRNPTNFEVNVQHQHKQTYFIDSPSFLSLQTYGTVYRLPKDFKNSSSVKLLKTRLHSTSKASYQATYQRTTVMLQYVLLKTHTI